MSKQGGAGGGAPRGYPPSEFSQKYAPVMAPNGELLTPKDVFGIGGPFAGGVAKDRTKQAFKVTIKKLEKLNAPSQKIKKELETERVDQVS